MVLGDPYAIDGVQYRPSNPGYSDETGYAGFLGDAARAAGPNDAADYVPAAVTALHKTLPVPSYVEVTSLATGRTIVARIIGRGPMVNGRLIDLSCGAAEQLGLMGVVSAPVRVRRVNPSEPERGLLRSGGRAAERLPAPAPLLSALRKKVPAQVDQSGSQPCGVGAPPSSVTSAATPKPPKARPAPKPKAPPAAVPSARPLPPPEDYAPPPVEDGFMIEEAGSRRAPPVHARPVVPAPSPVRAAAVWSVQIAALANRAKANQLAAQAHGQVIPAGRVYRVRVGRYPDEVRARAAAQTLRAKGFAGAHVVTMGGD